MHRIPSNLCGFMLDMELQPKKRQWGHSLTHHMHMYWVHLGVTSICDKWHIVILICKKTSMDTNSLSTLRFKTNGPKEHALNSTPPKSNIDAQNDGFLDVSPFKHGNFRVSILDFRGVNHVFACWFQPTWSLHTVFCRSSNLPQSFITTSAIIPTLGRFGVQPT